MWFAAIVFGMHVAKHFLIVTRQPIPVILLAHFLQFALMFLCLWAYRPKGLLPRNTAERQLWSVWLGYILACLLISLVSAGLFERERLYDGVVYPYYAVVTGMAFFVLGSSYWGRCYAISAGFFLLAVLLPLRLHWGTLAFGSLWGVTLVAIGLRLRGLSRERGG